MAHTIDNTGVVGIAHADTIHHTLNVEDARRIDLTTVPQRATQEVVLGMEHITQGEDDRMAVRQTGSNLVGRLFVALHRHLVGRINRLEGRHIDTQCLLILKLRTEDDVTTLHQGGQHLTGRLAILPEVTTVVDVARDDQPHAACHGNRLGTHIGCTLAHGRRDARPMEPIGIVEDRLPIQIARLKAIERRVATVIDHLRRTHGHSLLHVVETHATRLANHMVGDHAVVVQVTHRSIGNLIGRQAAHELASEAVVGQRNGHIGLTTAKVGFKVRALTETVERGRIQAEHQLAKGYDHLHGWDLFLQ